MSSQPRRRYRQVVDLYTQGKHVILRDGAPVWVRPLNPFEQDTARSNAQIAKARLVLAINDLGSAETTKVRMYFLEDGIETARSKIVDAKVADSFPKMLDKLRIDEDWKERLDILERGLEDSAKPPEPEEIELLEKIATEYNIETGNRLLAERDYFESLYDDADEELLWKDYRDWYLERRGGEVLMAEYRLYQILFGIRVCDADNEIAPDVWNHQNCTHEEQFFESIADVRSAPEDLILDLSDGLADVDMLAREAKNSHRQGSSSDSSPLPSEAAESTSFTHSEIQPEHPGSSFSPSATPSPSSDSTS